LYGEYIEIFEPNGNDFNIEIGMFGFTYAEMVGSPEARQHFSLEERWMAEQLIRSFFTNPSNVMRGYTAGVRFLGGVRFRPGWIIQKSPDREGWP